MSHFSADLHLLNGPNKGTERARKVHYRNRFLLRYYQTIRSESPNLQFLHFLAYVYG